jgi:hypothetical protein
MTDTTRVDSTRRTGWVGWIVFAGTMLLLVGTFHVVQGLVAIFEDDFYLVGKNGLVVTVDYTAWGWTHLIAGIIIIFAGIGLFRSQLWARLVGMALALISALLNFAFIAAYPIWSAVVIAIDVFVIYALTVHGEEMKLD